MSRNEKYKNVLGGITVKQLVEESGYSRVSIYNWLNGKGKFVGVRLAEILKRLKQE